jgi:hypothetical protein
MAEINESTWQRLLAKLPSAGAMHSVLALENSTTPAMAAVDSSGGRHLLIPVDARQRAYEDRESRGLNVATKLLKVEKLPEASYLDMTCDSERHYGIFNLIAGEIAIGLEAPDVLPSRLVRDTLAKWRDFWANLPSQALPEPLITGLFGELWFLFNWLLPYRRDAIDYWTGPHGSRHDFQFPHHSIEVKTTLSKVPVHRITGLEQMEPVEGVPLYFYSLRVRKEPSASNSLVQLVQEIDSMLDAGQAMTFRKAVSLAGFSPIHTTAYSDATYSIQSEGVFRVEPPFPCLTRMDIPADRLSGISLVEYDVSLANLDHLKLADSPSVTAWKNIIASRILQE